MGLAIWVLAIQFLAGFFVGLTSFGSNLFGIPLMTLVIGIKDSVIVSLLATVPLWGILSLIYYKSLRWREIIPLAIYSLLAGIPGTWMLAHISAFWILLGAGFSLTLIFLWQIAFRFLKRRETVSGYWISVPAGLVSGLMTGSIGMGGPPLMIYAYLRNWSKESTIGGGSFCACIQMLTVIPAQWQEGLFSDSILWLSLWAAIAGCAGLILSFPVVRLIRQDFFRDILLAILAFSAFVLIFKAFSLE